MAIKLPLFNVIQKLSLAVVILGLTGLPTQLTANDNADNNIEFKSFSLAKYGEKIDNPYTAEPSKWQNTLQSSAWKKLLTTESDVLVIPFQSDDTNHEFDASTRSLLSLTTANTLSSHGIKVADPILVAEALGLSRSHFDFNVIAKLAHDTHAKQVLLSTIGHDNKGIFDIKMSLFTRDSASGNNEPKWLNFESIAQVTRKGIKFNTVNLPYHWYAEKHSELLEEIFDEPFHLKTSPAKEYKIDTLVAPRKFPVSQTDNPLEAAKKLQFLAQLHPDSSAERAGHWLYERSVIELDKLGLTEETSFLKATAWLALNRRPSAMELLNELPASARKNALHNYANGNVIDSKRISRINDPVDRVSAHIRNQRIRHNYQLTLDETSLDDLDDLYAWKYLVHNAMHDGNKWRSTTNDYLKIFLDEINTDNAYSYQSVLSRQSIVGSVIGNASLEQAIISHSRKIDHISDSNISTDSLAVRTSDLMHLVRTQLAENIHDKIHKTGITRAKLDSAVDQIKRFDLLLAGQPDFSMVASVTYGNYSANDNVTPDQAAIYSEKSANYAAATLVHANNLILKPNNSLRNLSEHDIFSGLNKSRLVGDTVWPYTCYFSGGAIDACLENTLTEFTALMNAVSMTAVHGGSEGAKNLLKNNHHRFIGNNDRLQYLRKQYETLNDTEGLDRIAAEVPQTGNTDWNYLHSKATDARLKSKFDLAAEIILQYPEFDNNVNISAVSASNRSYSIGSRMYWAGAHNAAARMFEKTASRNTGASSETSARARLATIEGDYLNAIKLQYDIAQRYQSSYAMRDMLGLMAIMYNGEDALKYAYSLTPFLTKPEVWHGSFFAHRANGSSLEQQRDWLASVVSEEANSPLPHDKESRENIKRYSNNYLFMSTFIDRSSTARSLEPILEQLKDDAQLLRHFSSSTPVTEWSPLIQPMFSSPGPVHTETVPNPQLTAAKVLHSLYKGHFSEAEKQINAGKLCHGFEKTSEYLWLCAWAASQTDRATKFSENIQNEIIRITEMLSGIQAPQGQLFDLYVALAMLKAFDGQHDQSIELLYQANADHLYTEQRALFVRYHLLEVAQVLFEATNNDQYKSFILEHAKNYSIVDPIAAYNYSYIARLSETRKDRITALAFLLRLDAKSSAISTANTNEMIEAEKQSKLIYTE